MLASVETQDEAIQLAREVTYIHAQGGFKLHNWMANTNEVLPVVGGNGNRLKDMTLDHAISTQKVLGLWWDAHNDTFQFKIPHKAQEILQGKVMPTKRQLLSVLMSIFDPLGLIAAFLLYLKVLLQDVWRAGTEWDEEIPATLHNKWKKWIDCLPVLQKISVPRCYRLTTDLRGCTNELHIFVDAGKDGYAAAAYFRIESSGQREVSLIGGKTRVAPLNYISIPRLELQAAVLGVRLAKIIEKAHRIPIHRRFFWSDSKDVLCWLASDHRRYSTYVAHRVGEILENSTIDEWHWIPTIFNVADEGTKWSNLNAETTFTNWFNGPRFLQNPEDKWDLPTLQTRTTEEERRQTVSVHQPAHPVIEFERFSRWVRLHRAVAYAWRFINNVRQPKASRNLKHLTHLELQQAERTILKLAQQQEYPVEYKLLQEGQAGTGCRWHHTATRKNRRLPAYQRGHEAANHLAENRSSHRPHRG